MLDTSSEFEGINLFDHLTNIFQQQLEYDKVVVKDPKLMASLNNEYVHRIK